MINDIKTLYDAILKRKGSNCKELELPINIGYGIAVAPSIPVEDPRYDIIPWEEVVPEDIYRTLAVVYNTELANAELIFTSVSNSIKLGISSDYATKSDHLPEGFYYFYREEER